VSRWVFFTWLVLLFVATSIPSGAFPEVRVLGVDKLTHLFLYAALTTFLFFSYGKKNWEFLWIIAIIAIVDEIHQHFIPGRCMSYYDLIADFLGGGLTFWVLKS